MTKKLKVTQVLLAEIFEYWIEQEAGCKHRVFDKDMQKQIKARLADYSPDDLKYWIKAVGIIWKGEEYWYTHKWTLEDFMKRGFKKFREEQEPYKHFKKGEDSLFGSPSGVVGSPPSDPTAPSPALARKQKRFLQWSKATTEERKELAKQWKEEQ